VGSSTNEKEAKMNDAGNVNFVIVHGQAGRNFFHDFELHMTGASASSEAPRSAQILGEIGLNRGSREDKENALSQILRFAGDLHASAGGSIAGAS
jgi:hypothetical protein